MTSDIRKFSDEQSKLLQNRSIDNDAPAGLRNELIDLIFQIFAQHPKCSESQLHKIITQSLGVLASGNPMVGFRHDSARCLNRADWPRVYDLIGRLWPELQDPDLADQYYTGVNRILAGYHIAWELDIQGQLRRVLPVAVRSQAETTFEELTAPRFASALSSFRSAMDAYNARPQTARDAGKNIFDALESVAKEAYAMPTATFGDLLQEVRKRQALAPDTISVLQKLYDMANHHFRHGMTAPFTLKSPEVDLFMVSCLGSILLFVRSI